MKITTQRHGLRRHSAPKSLAEGHVSNGWSSATDCGERISLTVSAPVAGRPYAHDLLSASLTGEEFDKLVAFVTSARKRHQENCERDQLMNDPQFAALVACVAPASFTPMQRLALAALNRLVSEGVEFPDASHRVRAKYYLGERSLRQVIEAYDAQ